MPKMVLFRTTLSSDLPVSRQMDTIAAGSVLRSHGLYPYLAINRLYTLILGQPPSFRTASKRSAVGRAVARLGLPA
jgi:hypothetical protein